MKKLGMLLIVMLLATSLAWGVPVFVNIRDTLEGHFPIDNISVNNGVVEVNAIWENLGSVTCNSYLRVDVLDNESKVRDTFWSNMEEVTPGDSAYYKVYVYLYNYSGNITLKQRFYYCNEISTLKEFNVSYESQHIRKEREGVNVSYRVLNNTHIYLEIKTNRTINGTLYVLPEKTPIGWVVESTKLNVMNGEGKGEIYISKPQKSEKELKMYLVLSAGNESKVYEKKIKITKNEKKEGRKYNWTLIISVSLNILLALLLLYFVLYKNKKKREKSKDKKGSKKK